MSTQLHIADTEPRLFTLAEAPAASAESMPAPKARKTTPLTKTAKTATAPKAVAPVKRTARQDANLAAVREAKAAKAAASKAKSDRKAASWHLDETTRQTGRAGVAAAREALLAARKAQFGELDAAA